MRDFEKMKPKPEETGGIDGGKWAPKKKKRSKTPYIIGAVILIIIIILILI